MREYRPGHPLVFSHIPKTAGTSLGAALEEVLQPRVVVHGIDSALFGGYDDVNAVSPLLRPGIYLGPEELPVNAELVAGHVAPGTTMARYPGSDHITVLRSPQVRLLSQWLHSRSLSEFTLRRWGVSADAFRAGRRPLKEYLRNDMVAPSVDNTITRFLAFPHPLLGRREFIDVRDDDALVAAAIERLDAFAHVNLVENPGFLADIAAWLGADLPDTQLNERTSVLPKWRPDLDAELDDAETRELLEHRCRLDVRVWEHVASRVLPGQDAAEVLDRSFARARERYGELLQRPYDASLTRRVVERAWDVRTLLPGGSPTGELKRVPVTQQIQQVRRLVPVRKVDDLVESRLERLWRDERFRRGQIAEMDFLLGRSSRADEVPELARAYTAMMLRRAYLRWHPGVITRQRVRGVEWLTHKRDDSRPAILSFTHHYHYEGMLGSLVRAGAPRMKIVITEGITRPEAGIAFAQHLRVASRGGSFMMAELGTKGLASQLLPGDVMALAPDFPGNTRVEFLGRTVLAPSGTPRLAQLTGSPIYLVTQRRDDVGSYLQVDEPLEPSDFATPRDLMVEILRRHGEAILDWPEALESPSARFGPVVDD